MLRMEGAPRTPQGTPFSNPHHVRPQPWRRKRFPASRAWASSRTSPARRLQDGQRGCSPPPHAVMGLRSDTAHARVLPDCGVRPRRWRLRPHQPPSIPAPAPCVSYSGTYEGVEVHLVWNGRDAEHGVDLVGTVPAALSTYLALQARGRFMHGNGARGAGGAEGR